MAYFTAFGGIKFFTAGTPKGIIDYSGNFGLGTLNPNAKLDVNGAIMLPGSTVNTISRPTVTSARITGEIAGYSSTSPYADDGLLRLSAGGGTNSNVKTFIDLTGYSTVPDMDRNLVLGTGGAERVRIDYLSRVGIGTASPDQKLSVKGTIHSQEVLVDMNGWSDFVFKPKYKLLPLADVKTYIDQHQHLPDMPSEQEVTKNGINLGEMVKIQTKKIEELTLYLIDQQKINQSDKAQLQSQQDQINELKSQLAKLIKQQSN